MPTIVFMQASVACISRPEAAMSFRPTQNSGTTRMQETGTRFGITARMAVMVAMLLACGVGMNAQSFHTIYAFPSPSGPYAGMIQGTDGNLYGTTTGAKNSNGQYGGSVYRITPSGKLTTIYYFCSLAGCADGSMPYAGLVEGTDGNFYGVTSEGGTSTTCMFTYGCGTIFKVTPSGVLTTLHNFDQKDGYYPIAPLIQASDGNFYGTASSGGQKNSGTVFKVTPTGKFTTLHFFNLSSDGASPYSGLVQGTDGNLYGTTANEGVYGGGTVFKMTLAGNLTVLHSFNIAVEGASPYAALIQGPIGNFYGTTYRGGVSVNCSGVVVYGCGTAFSMTPTGTVQTFYTFCTNGTCLDGVYPYGGLVLATDGNFYGTTANGGLGPFCYLNCGTVYEVTSGGTLTTLHNFYTSFNHDDGITPFDTLVQHTNGNLYGVTWDDGPVGGGTVFEVSLGLAVFVENQPAFGAAGAAVRILGTNLAGATSVTFNGTPATFKVISGSLIKATVPVGATTGAVQVVTPTSTLTSNVPFTVTP